MRNRMFLDRYQTVIEKNQIFVTIVDNKLSTKKVINKSDIGDFIQTINIGVVP